jgi:hypothetical protein
MSIQFNHYRKFTGVTGEEVAKWSLTSHYYALCLGREAVPSTGTYLEIRPASLAGTGDEMAVRRLYSTVTLLARLRGLSMSRPSLAATW